MIIWITGLSGSGKTTISQELFKKYKPKIKNLVCVDGDVIRNLYDNDLAYDEKSRIKQIIRIQKLCDYLNQQKLIVIVAALYNNVDLMTWNQKNFQNYFQIYLNAPVDLVKKRDPKKLYYKYEKGLQNNIVGIDIPWHNPINSDLTINMTEKTNKKEVLEIIKKNIEIFRD